MDMPDPHRHEASAPQLRTLLLTDLCDSTSLVERLGDSEATALFREHDRLVLQLQQQWRGRLIDRSDGLLLLFERPIDGLGFALDYGQGLRAMGAARRLTLLARAGLHVGEVLTWRNSVEAVNVGAKPLEVEGLAKPMAGRLMSMARPGQILLSAVAEPLAHRAARELGERGQALLWKSHGRWRFKGVPEPQEIYEVGEPGIAPLRAPPNSPKAWRDLPLWRRPAALAAELALVAGLGFAGWFVTRPQPAIAFAERDWVVVGDLRNLTGDRLLDDSLQQAFRISLEQSRFVNVLSDLKARDTLARMQRKPGTPLDRAIASEIALRDGARAVILPTVSEVGGRVRVSAEVIDPHSQATVYAESADGRGAGSTLASIDTVTAALRGKLGEALRAIEHDSAPLPQVTTGNLDALRAYALAQGAYGKQQFAEAMRFYALASRLDPRFALAWIGQVRVQVASVNAPAAAAPLQQALALRERLAPREAMYLDGWAAEITAPHKALEAWKQLADLYPDYFPGNANAAYQLIAQNRFKEALPLIVRNTIPQNDLASTAYDALGRVRMGMEQYRQAGQAYDLALARGFNGALRRRAAVEAAQRDFVGAQRRLQRGDAADPFAYFETVSLALDRAQWAQAQQHSRRALQLTGDAPGFVGRVFLVPAAVSDWLAEDHGSALVHARAAADRAVTALAGRDADARDNAGLALSAALLAQRLGDRTVAPRVLRALGAYPEATASPVVSELLAVVRAREASGAGRSPQAIGLLEPLLTGNEQYQTRVALQEAYAAAGRIDRALEQSRWLQAHRGLAYVELGAGQSLQALNVVDSTVSMLGEAELLVRAGKPAEARQALQRFDRAWPLASLPQALRLRYLAVLSASRLGVV